MFYLKWKKLQLCYSNMRVKRIRLFHLPNPKAVSSLCLICSMESTLCKSCTVLSFLKFLLSLAELSKIESCNFFSFLNLLLVGFDLLLQFRCKLRHAVLVLLVLIILELKFLYLTLCLLVTLHVISSVGLNISKLNLKLTDAGFQLGHCILTTTHSALICIGKAVFHFSHLSFKRPFRLGKNRNMVLLSSQFICKSCSINQCFLCFFFRVLCLMKHIINFCLHGVKRSFNTSFLSSSSRVDSCHFINSRAGLSKFSFSLSLASFSRIKKGSGLLHLTLQRIGPAVSKTCLFCHFLTDTGGLLIKTVSFPKLSLISLYRLEGLIVGFVCMVQCNFKLIDLTLLPFPD